MKYLKNFETETDYLTYRDGSDYLKPNVSLCEGNKMVYYNYPPPPKTNGHDYVDLGLPSGTLWATCNVGASNPSDFGLYFQWGDVQGYKAEQVGTGEGKKAFAWSDYKWRNGNIFTKYDVAGATLGLKDDAANANMGGDWHMPTPTQIRELLDNTTRQNGVKGIKFTSKNGNSIFIPAAGEAWDGSFHGSGGYGSVWSSMLSAGGVSGGQYLNFSSRNASLYDYGRYGGFSVRGVIGEIK